MLLADPQPTRFDLQFSLGAIPVRVHPSFWLITGLFGLMQASAYPLGQSLVVLALWLAAALISILVHELGHAIFARVYGRHSKITIYGMGGMASYPSAPESLASRIAIALAGPGAGFILGGLVLAAIALSGYQAAIPGLPIIIGEGGGIGGNLGLFVQYILLICFFWGFINLAPVPPLDGGTVAQCIFQKIDPSSAHARAAQLGLVTSIALVIAALMLYRSTFLAIMFGMLGYQCYQDMQNYR